MPYKQGVKTEGQGKRGPGKFSEFKQSFLEVADAIKWKENLIKLIRDEKGGVNTKHFKWFTEQILKIVPKDVSIDFEKDIKSITFRIDNANGNGKDK